MSSTREQSYEEWHLKEYGLEATNSLLNHGASEADARKAWKAALSSPQVVELVNSAVAALDILDMFQALAKNTPLTPIDNLRNSLKPFGRE